MYRYAILFTILLTATVYGKPTYNGADVQQYVAVSNDLGYQLQRAKSYGGSQLISPYGISAILGALYQATEGKTQEEIGRIGYKDLEQQGTDIAESHKQLAKTLQQSSENVQVEEATALVYPSEYSVSATFQDILESSYEALVQESQGTRSTTQKVYRWFKQQTDGKISKVFGNIDASHGLALLNAVYFEGKLQIHSNQVQTKRDPFYNADGTKSHSVVSTETQSAYPYYEDEQIQAVQLPFEDEEYTFLVILPTQHHDVRDFQQQVSSSTIRRIINQSQKTQVRVTIPQFTLDYSQILQHDIRSLGITSVFDHGAEFSEVSPKGDARVSQIAQRSVIEVGQSGSSYEEYEDGSSQDRQEQVEFRANRPFVFYLIHEPTGLNLLAGRTSHL